MKKNNLVGFDYYSSEDIREISHALKNSEPHAIHFAAVALIRLIPDYANLIPLPSSTGHATHTLLLAEEIRKLNPTLTVIDCLKGNNRQPLYVRKKLHLPVDDSFFGFRLTDNIELKNTFLLDNVFATGTTVAYARKSIGAQLPYVVFAKDFSLSLVNAIDVIDRYRFTTSPEHVSRPVICVLDEFCFVLEQDFKSFTGLVQLRLNKIIEGLAFGGFPKSELDSVLNFFKSNNHPYALVEQL